MKKAGVNPPASVSLFAPNLGGAVPGAAKMVARKEKHT